VGLYRVLRMKLGQLVRGSREPAPVGRPDYYRRELASPLFIRSVENVPVRNFLTGLDSQQNVRDSALLCRDRYGYFPLSFSFPQPGLMPIDDRERPHFLSTTIPGEPFSFDSWEDYLAEYRSSYFALSTKKGGWDTFRHLEVLFSGGIPLIPGISALHPHSLALYPKKALGQVMTSLLQDGPAVPDATTQQFFRDYSLAHLSSKAMAEYCLDVSGLGDATVLFLDAALVARTDYLSAFSFIGLKQAIGSRVREAFAPEYLFDDFVGDTQRLYGRGFGYSRSLPAKLRSTEALSAEASTGDVVELSEAYDAVVVGNYDANRDLVSRLLAAGVPAQKFVCVVGSDSPVDFRLAREIRRSGMTFFVREFGGV